MALVPFNQRFANVDAARNWARLILSAFETPVVDISIQDVDDLLLITNVLMAGDCFKACGDFQAHMCLMTAYHYGWDSFNVFGRA